MRLIDANALAKHIKDLPTWWADDGGVYPGGSMKYPDGMYYPEDIISSIDNAPSVDAVEVVHGRWEKHMEEMEDFYGKTELVQTGLMCSVCGSYSCCGGNYCHNCGAKMDGDGNG